MGVDTKSVAKIAELVAEATKVQQVNRRKENGAHKPRAQADAMQYTLPLKENRFSTEAGGRSRKRNRPLRMEAAAEAA